MHAVDIHSYVLIYLLHQNNLLTSKLLKFCKEILLMVTILGNVAKLAIELESKNFNNLL